MDFERRKFLCLAVGVGVIVVSVLSWFAGIVFHFGNVTQLALWSSTALLCAFYQPPADSWLRKLVDSFEFLSLLSLIATLGAAGSYVVAALTTGYADDWLAGVDRAVGFDWVGLYTLTSQSWWIGQLGGVAYGSIFSSPAVLLLVFAWTGRRAEARRFLFAFGVALAFTLLIFALVPARAALDHYMGAHPPYLPQSGNHHVQIIESLRDGTMHVVDLANLAGLIAFPSFHAASAFLLIWAAWPVRRLRWPMLAVNLMMLAATPIEGGHYLVDLAGGALVAWLGVASLRLTRPRPAPALRLQPA